MTDYNHPCLNLGAGRIIIPRASLFENLVYAKPTEKRLLAFMVTEPNIMPPTKNKGASLIAEEW